MGGMLVNRFERPELRGALGKMAVVTPLVLLEIQEPAELFCDCLRRTILLRHDGVQTTLCSVRMVDRGLVYARPG